MHLPVFRTDYDETETICSFPEMFQHEVPFRRKLYLELQLDLIPSCTSSEIRGVQCLNCTLALD